MQQLFTDEGKKFARYIFVSHVIAMHIPWAGKYAIVFLQNLCYQTMLKIGAQEHARNKRETEVSRMRRGVSLNRGQITEKLREMWAEFKRVQGTEPTVGRVPEEQESQENKPAA